MTDRRDSKTVPTGEAARQFQALVTQVADGVIVVDTDGIVHFVNPAAEQLLGRSTAELIGTNLGQPIVVGGSTEMTVMHKDGSLITVELRAATVTWEGAPAVLTSLRDVSDRIQAQTRIEHLNSVLRAIRNVNQLIVRERDPTALIQRACELLVETRGYGGVWIAIGDGRSPSKILSQAGWGEEFAPFADLLRQGKWPACVEECLASDNTLAVADVEVSCEGCPRLDAAERNGALITTLRHGGNMLGLMGVSLVGPSFDDEEERSLLTKAAEDIALALHTIEIERHQLETDRQLAQRAHDLGERVKELRFLHATSLLISDEHRTVEDVLQGIVDLLPSAMQHSECTCARLVLGGQEYQARGFVETPWLLSAELQVHNKPAGCIEVGFLGQPESGEEPFLPEEEQLLTTVARKVVQFIERRLAEEALLRSEAQLKLAQQVAHIGHWELDAYDGTPVWSDEIYRIFGLEPGTAAPSFTSHDKIIHPDEWSVLDEAMRAGFKNGEDFDLVSRILRPDHEPRWMQAIGTATRDDQGKVVKMFGTAQDVTERILSERKQRESEELFQLSFEDASIGKSLTLPDGTMSQVNAAFCNLLGYTHEELRAKGFSEVTHPDDLALSREAIRCLLAGEQRHYRMEKRYLRKDGQTVWTDFSTILLRNEDGSPRCFVTHVLDISGRKEAVNALRESQQLLEEILDAIPARVFWKDKDLVFLGCNAAFARDAGVASPQDLIGKDDFQTAWRDQAELYRSSDREVIEKGITRLLYEEPQTTPAGDTNTLLTSKLPLRSATGEITGVVGTYMDITELKRLQAQLAQADRLSSMGMLAASVAHEINNPLSYILYNLESLTEDLPALLEVMRQFQARLDNMDPEILEDVVGDAGEKMNAAALDEILSRFKDALGGTHRIRDIARGLGTFSKMEEDQLVPVNLMNVIDVAINMAFNEIKYRARLVRDYSRTPTILASEGRLSQVFLNLIINATHAITEGDVESNEIRIRTWTEADEVCAEVRDTGCGIAAEHVARLFDPFFTTKKIGAGSGLGLAISKNIVESYKGTIQVSSEVGKGTSFIIRLPVRQQEVATLEVSSATPTPGIRGRILIVDDEAGIRTAMARMLRGHETVQAANGAEAIGILEKDMAFDLVLCDVMMPDISGMDLHEWLTERQPQLAKQLIFITGGAFTPRARDYLSKVDNIRLEKPFDVTNFKRIVGDRIHMAKATRPE